MSESLLVENEQRDIEEALTKFYRKHNPSMIEHVSSVASYHKSNITGLNAKLREKYQVDLSDIGVSLQGDSNAYHQLF